MASICIEITPAAAKFFDATLYEPFYRTLIMNHLQQRHLPHQREPRPV